MNWSNIIVLLPTIVSAIGQLIKTAAPNAAGPTSDAMAQMLSFEVTLIKEVQQLLNGAQLIGIISFGDPLVIDGIAGPKTNAALQAALAKFNVKI